MGNMGKFPTKDKWFLEYDFATHFPHPIPQVGTLSSSNKEEITWISREEEIGGYNSIYMALAWIHIIFKYIDVICHLYV